MASQQLGMEEGTTFARAFQQGFGTTEQQAFELAQRKAMTTALAPVADALKGAQSPQAVWDVVSKNPQWLANPVTQPFVSRALKTATDVSRAESMSLEAKMKLKDTGDFMKRLDAIDAQSRAQIGGMSKNPDGTPSAAQLQALGLAEQASAQAKEKARARLELEAEQARQQGARVTTHVDAKGQPSYTISPPTPGSVVQPPQMVTLGGQDFAFSPKTGALHPISGPNKDKPITASELFRAYQSERKAIGNMAIDADAQKAAVDNIAHIQAYVREKFPSQARLFGITNTVRAQAPAGVAPSPAAPASYPPAPAQADRVNGQIYQTPKGPFKWAGNGWQPLQ